MFARRILAGGGGSFPLPASIYYVAHADDATLWMMLAMTNDCLAGRTVIQRCHTLMWHSAVYALLTGGGGSCPQHSVVHNFPLTHADFTAAHDDESIRSTAVIGAAYSFPDDRMEDGALTQAYMRAKILTYATAYPAATHHCMSWVDSVHADHRATGYALRGLVDDGLIASERAVFHLRTEDMDDFAGTEVVALPGASALCIDAIAEEIVFDPGNDRYATGYHSVKPLYDDQLAGPHNKTHTPAQNR
jgi:hypothetical protein